MSCAGEDRMCGVAHYNSGLPKIPLLQIPRCNAHLHYKSHETYHSTLRRDAVRVVRLPKSTRHFKMSQETTRSSTAFDVSSLVASLLIRFTSRFISLYPAYACISPILELSIRLSFPYSQLFHCLFFLLSFFRLFDCCLLTMHLPTPLYLFPPFFKIHILRGAHHNTLPPHGACEQGHQVVRDAGGLCDGAGMSTDHLRADQKQRHQRPEARAEWLYPPPVSLSATLAPRLPDTIEAAALKTEETAAH